MGKLLLTIVMLLVVAGIAGFAGYSYGVQVGSAPKPLPGSFSSSGLKIGPASIIQSQQATAVGTITTAKDGFITVKADNNENGIFRLAPKFNIYMPTSSSSASKPSQDARDIQLDQKAIIELSLQDTEYVVTTVNYLPK